MRRSVYETAQKSEGISVTEFLSDNAAVLRKELARLIGSFKSGNLDVFDRKKRYH
jgi:hypothetical protein